MLLMKSFLKEKKQKMKLLREVGFEARRSSKHENGSRASFFYGLHHGRFARLIGVN